MYLALPGHILKDVDTGLQINQGPRNATSYHSGHHEECPVLELNWTCMTC